MSTLRFYQHIHFKIVVLFGLVALLGSLIGWYSTVQMTERDFRRLMFKQFNSAAALTENGFALIAQMGLIWAHHSSLDRVLFEAIDRGDAQRYQQKLQLIAGDARADVAILFDQDGIILAHSQRPERIGSSVMSWSPVRNALLADSPSSAIIQDLDNLIIYSSSQLVGEHIDDHQQGVVQHTDSKRRVGGLLLGFTINDELLRQLSSDSATEITLVRRRAVMASTFNTRQQRLSTIPISYIDYQSLLDDPSFNRRLPLQGKHYFVSAKRLKMMMPSQEGSILFSYPAEELEKIHVEVNRRFTIIFGTLFLLLMLVSNWIARQMLDPMQRLLERMTHLLRGDKAISLATTANRNDEIGLLTQNFNSMLHTIQEKNSQLHKQGLLLESRVAERTKVLEQLNARLERHSQHLTQAQQIAKVGSWEYEPIPGRFEGSAETLSLFGLTAGFDGTLETVLLKIHEDDRDRMQQKLEQALSEDRIVQYDFRLPDPTGEERILQMSCERTGDRNGQNIKLVGTLQDITDRRRSELLLIQQANYDALTGIPNRNLFSERLEQAVRVSRRDRRRFAVIFIDLDKFKEVNDTQGHDAGDLLLKEIALRFKQCVHTEDTVARLGGDEFAIILPALDHTDPCAITAQRIIDQASMPIPISEQASVQVGASLGIAFYPDDGNTAGTLMKCADQAMYAAKQGGRNRYCFFSTNVSVHLPRPPRGRGR